MKSLRNRILAVATVAIVAIFAKAIPTVAQTTTISVSTVGGELVQISDLQPFTPIAYIPASADLLSIKIESIKMVKIATKVRSVTNTRDCDDWPGNYPDCSRTTYESRVPALRVTYSYRDESAPSDESGTTYFTFSVYFRAEEINPGLRRALSAGKISRSSAVEFFEISTSRGSIQQEVIDEANSSVCDGYYADGNWFHTNPMCKDRVIYRKVASMSPYITVKVAPAPSFRETVRGGK